LNSIGSLVISAAGTSPVIFEPSARAADATAPRSSFSSPAAIACRPSRKSRISWRSRSRSGGSTRIATRPSGAASVLPASRSLYVITAITATSAPMIAR
jgi:hypothetical protein